MASGSDDRTNRRLSALALILSAILAIVGLAVEARAAPSFPPLTGRVVDAANILPDTDVAALDAKLAALEKQTSIQLVVATVPDLQGYEIDEYGYQLGRTWGIGQKGKNNGALLLVAPNERKVRIEVGYGLEGTLTDALTSQIIRRDIIPRFKAGDMAGGVVAGSDAIIKLVELPPEARRMAAAEAAQAQAEDDSGPSLGFVIWLVIILIWLFFAISRGRRGRRSGPVIIWGPGMGGGWGGGSGGGGGWGGGGFGGGGFGGGGGGFGGGGSSGGW
jgi:uncharacterized protein